MALAEVQYRQLLDKIDVNYDPGANRISEDGRATARQSRGEDELSVGVRHYRRAGVGRRLGTSRRKGRGLYLALPSTLDYGF